MTDLTRLYPPPADALPLQGAYLAHDLQGLAHTAGRPLVFSNFIASLDGRIAVPVGPGSELGVPPTIANARDWRLFQELAAQSDLIVIGGRFARAWAAGQGHEIAQLDDPRYADLVEHRRRAGLPAQPAVGVISQTLEVAVPDAVRADGRALLVFTHAAADPARRAHLQAEGVEVVIAGATAVDGRHVVAAAAARGYRVIFSATGPRVVHLFLAAGCLDRLYLTLAGRALGDAPYETIVEGPALTPPVDFALHSLLHDPAAPDGVGQLLLCYTARRADTDR